MPLKQGFQGYGLRSEGFPYWAPRLPKRPKLPEFSVNQSLGGALKRFGSSLERFGSPPVTQSLGGADYSDPNALGSAMGSAIKRVAGPGSPLQSILGQTSAQLKSFAQTPSGRASGQAPSGQAPSGRAPGQASEQARGFASGVTQSAPEQATSSASPFWQAPNNRLLPSMDREQVRLSATQKLIKDLQNNSITPAAAGGSPTSSLADLMTSHAQKFASDPSIGMGLSPGIQSDVDAIRAGGNPEAARAGISVSGSGSPRRGFTPTDSSLNAGRFDRIAAVDEARRAREAALPQAASGTNPFTGQTEVVSGSGFASQMLAGQPGARENFQEFRQYVDDFTSQQGRAPTLEELPMRIADNYRQSRQGTGVDPEKFQAAKQRRQETKELARQRQFARAQLPLHARGGAAFNDDGTLDRMSTMGNLAQAGRVSPLAMMAEQAASEERMGQDKMNLEATALERSVALEQQQVDEQIAQGRFQRGEPSEGGVGSVPSIQNLISQAVPLARMPEVQEGPDGAPINTRDAIDGDVDVALRAMESNPEQADRVLQQMNLSPQILRDRLEELMASNRNLEGSDPDEALEVANKISQYQLLLTRMDPNFKWQTATTPKRFPSLSAWSGKDTATGLNFRPPITPDAEMSPELAPYMNYPQTGLRWPF